MTDRIIFALALLAVAGLAVLIGVSQPRSAGSVLEGGSGHPAVMGRHCHVTAPHVLHCPAGSLPDAHVGCIAT